MLQWALPVGRGYVFLLVFTPGLESVNSGQMVAFRWVKTGRVPGSIVINNRVG